MPDWLLGSAYNGPVTAALWGTVASVVAGLLLFLYTLELRFKTVFRERRQQKLKARWREVIATAACPLVGNPPRLGRRERKDVLGLWNQSRELVEGRAVDGLIELAQHLGLLELARREATSRRFATRLLAIKSLGYLRDLASWDLIGEAVASENPALSITAAAARAEIKPSTAIAELVPLLVERRDWPHTQVFKLLQKAGADLISEPLYRAIRSADDDDCVYLLQFAKLAEFDVRDALAAELLISRKSAEVLASALKIVSGQSGVPRLAMVSRHPAWFVRMQAARVQGRIGLPEHLPAVATIAVRSRMVGTV